MWVVMDYYTSKVVFCGTCHECYEYADSHKFREGFDVLEREEYENAFDCDSEEIDLCCKNG